MGKVKVVADSTADIPEELAAELEITIVPCNVHFGLETYRDGLDLSKEDFYARLKTSPTLPTTSAPAVGLFEATYRKLANETDQILSIHLASALSAIYNSAHLGAEAVSGVEITLIDSGQVSMGLGWLVIAAARAAQEGQPLAQIGALVEDMRPRVRVFAALDTLEYLQKGGRVGKTAAALGTLLNIKPLVEVRDSAVLPLERVRTRRRSIQRLIELVAELGSLKELAVLHTNAPQEAQRLAEEVSFLHPLERILIAEAGVIIGTHAGPNALGAACVVARCPYRDSGHR